MRVEEPGGERERTKMGDGLDENAMNEEGKIMKWCLTENKKGMPPWNRWWMNDGRSIIVE